MNDIKETTQIAAVWLLSMLTIGFAGCGPANELGRLPLSGVVTIDGKPLDRGSISFSPMKVGEGARSGATIADGQFTIETLKGLPPGEYLVRINAASDTPAVPLDQATGVPVPPSKELVPPKYNSRSEETVTIKEGGENHFNFEIKTDIPKRM